jgi:hypothetical protein
MLLKAQQKESNCASMLSREYLLIVNSSLHNGLHIYIKAILLQHHLIRSGSESNYLVTVSVKPDRLKEV